MNWTVSFGIIVTTLIIFDETLIKLSINALFLHMKVFFLLIRF